ncbi:UDP-3-O-acyl-N-acetylglucosamine deacetylase [Pseudoruegeria sp. SHC-113]|uniref:UDP-3-O-acyl-N-acetylglucosamine deacetylase n=1 Tax=Pseudoruegeria sp. SHC-113 TaxID=2855439 RepID=UPI0021BB1549|nr:UDP-3-O-acyl-N-acetylglucosamine deacetylase [Pseudoruegeria sp. SHC-113]MCT8161025.1 UDP-3-O-acyl-N-acetylglucosamine deacetylase [Pseudoruegeria sp. SHC-113]
MQTTIKSAVQFKGVGLHSGAPVRMTVHPASAEYGIWFRRTDLDFEPMIPALWDAVGEARLCTRIDGPSGASVQTIEHIMAALAGCGIQNALIEIDGPEVPVMDGSSAHFVQALLAAGVRKLDAPVRAIRVLKPVEYREGEAFARLEPSETFLIDFHIDFEDAAIGRQDKVLNMANGAFVRELSDSRTFCRQSDIEVMRANGLALGGSLENAVVVDGAEVLTPGGLRHKDEAVRHKMLDALGDLALAGAPLLGRYVGHRAGHMMTNQLLRKLFADPTAFEMVTCDTQMALRLPGVGVHKADVPLHA